jgi:hypothetical protein
MPLDPVLDGVEADFEILDQIGAAIDSMADGLIRSGAVQKTIRRWLVGHAALPDDGAAQTCLSAMAADLDMHTPSMSGRTMVDRYLKAHKPETPEQRMAWDALAAAQFRLVRIVGREGPSLIRLTDLVTGENLLLLHAYISEAAAGIPTAMRLCPLPSGRHVLISPLFAMDEAMLNLAMGFVRPGRPLGTGHRCAASLYREVARRGFMPMPLRSSEWETEELFDAFMEVVENRLPIETLVDRWVGVTQPDADLLFDTRQFTSVDHLVNACCSFSILDATTYRDRQAAFEQIASVMVETLALRARSGMSDTADALDRAAAEIADLVAEGLVQPGARDLFERLRLRWSCAAEEKPAVKSSPATDEIDRVIKRIQALRARTVDHGCTEAEAMEAAAKVSQLLERYELTLDEISVRRSACEGISVATGRKRRAPVDSCKPAIAEFCDCRVWSEERADGQIFYVFFGLKADVAAARFLNDLIDVTFDTETAAFRQGELYLAQQGGNRRVALNSFQIGLAGGIDIKLNQLKAARHSTGPRSTGFDLVAVKNSVVDEEVERLGLHFVSRQAGSRRKVYGAAYQAGKEAGFRFEPNPGEALMSEAAE